MPPTVALYACYAFVAYMFRRDAKQNPYPSAILWLPTLWMMRCGSRSIDYWLGGGEGGRLDPVFIAVMIVLGLAVLVQRPCQWGAIISHNSLIFLFYGLMVASVTWCPELDVGLIKLLRPLGDLIMALVLLTERDPRAALITMFRRTGILLIPLSIVLIRYFPHLGKMENKHWGADIWIGVTTHKNPLGQIAIVAAMGFLSSLYEIYLREGKIMKLLTLKLWDVWLYFGMTAYILHGGGNENSQSSTSILCLIIAVALFAWFGRMKNHIQKIIRRIMLGLGAVITVALLLQLVGSSLQEVVAEMSGKDATLSDRTYLWADVIRIGKQNMWLGSGYGGFWIPAIYDQLSPLVDNRPAEAHNGFLETYANLGLVGCFLLALAIVQSIRSASKVAMNDFEYGRIRLALLFMVIVMNYSEATFPRGTHLWWFGFLIVALNAREFTNWPQPLVVEEQWEPEPEPEAHDAESSDAPATEPLSRQ